MKIDMPKQEASQANSEDYERCIICNAITQVHKSTHVDLRDRYVEGSGQLCPKCAMRVASHNKRPDEK
jgi:uncharacterized protein YlaI